MSGRSVSKVAVLILNWNGRQHLELCLEALDLQTDPGVDWEVLVLDNASTDDSWSWLEQHWPEKRRLAAARRPAPVRRFRAPENSGFCRGNNWLAEQTDADALVMLNNDTRAGADWLGALVDTLARAPDDVAAASGLLVDWHGEKLDFARGVMTFDGHAFQRGFGHALEGFPLPVEGEELLFACGGNMIIRAERFRDNGGFDVDYFAYLEDVDLGWRLWSQGHRIVAAPGAVVHHRSMATSDQLGQFNRGFLFERNAYLTAYKNYDEELWPQIMPAVLLTLLARTQTLLVENNPGGAELLVDPYADPGAISRAASGNASRHLGPSLWRKWRGWGTRELARRGVRRMRRRLARVLDPDSPPTGVAPRIEDPRSVAQLRTVSYLLHHLDHAADRRRNLQARRVRSDRELFERFPLLIVPTYPGDARLFASSAFTDWLPQTLRFERATLGDLMAGAG